MSRPAVARLLVIRHGESEWNAEGRWQGTENPPLSGVGVRQARAAAEVLGGFDAVVASPLERALATATIIADHLGIGPVATDAGLAERHAGAFQGLTRDEIEARFPGYLAVRRRPEGWEDDDSVVARSIGALARIAAEVGLGGTALVVSHGGVIGCLERLCDAPREVRLANLAGRWFEVAPGVLRADEPVELAAPAEVSADRNSSADQV